MNEIEVLPAGQLSLFELADIANREHALAMQSGQAMIEHWWRCGEALIEAKSRQQRGEWLPWIKAHIDFGPRQAQKYMRLVANTNPNSHLASIDKALAAISRKQSVTYLNQPGIDASGGTIPLEGTSHLYKVGKLLWPEQVESFLAGLLIPKSLHVCCGKSPLGDVRLDADETHRPDIVADAADIPVDGDSFESVLCDPPYNGDFQWNHSLLDELARIARKRIVFQHWFIPANPDGRYKKAQEKFVLSGIYAWQPKTYFGRAQVISVFDAL